MTQVEDSRRPRISAIVITRDEACNIGACLDSMSFCDERIVVDSGSTDDTVEIARAHGADVRFNEWPGYGPQKNHALSLARGEWVLSLDADERVTPELARQILAAVDDSAAAGFEFPRSSRFCGRVMRHGGHWPDYVLRLFRREAGRFADRAVHERVIVDGPVRRLAAPLEHLGRDGLEAALGRIDSYSTLGARMLVESGTKVGFHSGITHALWAFFDAYVFRRGVFDGREGFLAAVAAAEMSYYRYMKAWLLLRQDKKPE